MRRASLLFPTLVLLPLSTAARAQLDPVPQDEGFSGLGLALRPLGVTGSVLYITAHPDDESSGLQVWLSRGLGLRVGLLTLTRGEGGQNEIGRELGAEIGILRTAELVAAHRYDRVEQRFSRAYEFGYSFSVEETFERWGREETIGDIVRVLREFRPDVVLTMVPTGEGGGQHHQASARLASEAVRRAADRAAFPELSEDGLWPWTTQETWRVPFRPVEDPDAVRIDVGEFDPLLGASAAEFGAASRNLHRSQGMNAPPIAGPAIVTLLPERADDPEQKRDEAPFDRSMMSITGLLRHAPPREDDDLLRRLAEIHALADAVRETFANGGGAAGTARVLVRGLSTVRALRRHLAELDGTEEIAFHLAHEEEDWRRALEVATFVHARAEMTSADGEPDGTVTPGETFRVAVRVVARGDEPLDIDGIELALPEGWRSAAVEGSPAPGRRLERGGVMEVTFDVTVPEDARVDDFHLRRPAAGDVPIDRNVTLATPTETPLPFLLPQIRARLSLHVLDEQLTIERVVERRWYDATSGQHRAASVVVVPRATVTMERDLRVVPRSREARPVSIVITARHHGQTPADGTLRLDVPPGFTVEPTSATMSFERPDEARTVAFSVTCPADASGDQSVVATLDLGGRPHRRGFRLIDHSHIEPRRIYRDAVMTLRFVDVAIAPNLHIGYVMGVGDDVPRAIEDLGARVSLLDAQDLARGDLDRFDAIVLGIRAYKDRDDLIAHNQRLLDWVAEGGVLICQYQKYEFLRAAFGPYPLSISRPHDRITDETAPVTLLEPASPIVTRPNAIGPADWDGWVQERGLYFLGQWDERYRPLLEIRDPFPYNSEPKRGALIVAEHGEGLWIYTGLALFRQLPAGVPGAHRLLANLLSLRPRDQ